MIRAEDLLSEIHFRTTRSSGPGGQNVNKVDSRVVLRFNVNESELLSEVQKSRLLKKLASRLTSKGELIISSQSARTQLANKKKALERLEDILNKALVVEKKRKKTKPSKGAVEKRLKSKKEQKEKKERRKKLDK